MLKLASSYEDHTNQLTKICTLCQGEQRHMELTFNIILEMCTGGGWLWLV